MFDIITYQISNNFKVMHHLYQFVFYLGALSSLISTTNTTSTITLTTYTQSTLVYDTVKSTSSTTDTSCVTLCIAGRYVHFIHTKFMFTSTQLLYQSVCFSLVY